MTPDEQARWQAMGYRAKVGAERMHRDLADWETFSRTLGFFQWKQKHALTEEQLARFEEGFKHDKRMAKAVINPAWIEARKHPHIDIP